MQMKFARFKLAIAVAMGIVAAGCAAGANDHSASASVTTEATKMAEQPTTTEIGAPYPGIIIQMAAAKPINTATDAVPTLNLQNLVTISGQSVYFGQLETYDNDGEVDGSIPVLARRSGQDVLGIKVQSDTKANESWAYVGAGPTKNEIWGIIDANLDDATADLLLVHSGDGGKSFAVQRLHKPHPAAQFDSFSMSREGVGRVSVYLARADAGARGAGYYHYRTKDGGRTWSSAQYEHDSMLPAQDVPDEDEPSHLQRAAYREKTPHPIPLPEYREREKAWVGQ
jgi:hypothetical protein